MIGILSKHFQNHAKKYFLYIFTFLKFYTYKPVFRISLSNREVKKSFKTVTLSSLNISDSP